ncbi:MAG: ATP-grasp domain-containing protein [Clostridiales bacterium]|nr:ATP-grasp domain-containing protein [Candidatus Equinaster intestinalis]
MKKTLMVIGNMFDERINAIVETAKELDIRTVVIGGIYDEPTEKAADVYYVHDLNDAEYLIELGKKEKIDGVVSAFDKAMLSVMKVAQALKLPGISPASIEKLFCKGKFRQLQKESGAFYPEFLYSGKKEDFVKGLENFNFPIIIKPDRSSASRGQSIVEQYDEKAISDAFDRAVAESVNKLVCAEEFVKCVDLNVLEGDVFVLGDEILWDGLRYCWRTEDNPLVPSGDIMPIHLPEEQLKIVKKTVSDVLKNAGCTLGVYNFESYFTENGDYFIVEINPRQAGQYNPQEIMESTGVDLTKLLVTTALDDMSYFEELKHFERRQTPILTCTLFSEKDGIYKDVWLSDKYKEHLISVFPVKEKGVRIRKKQAAIDVVSIYHFKFDSEAERDEYMRGLYKNICVILEEE